MQGNDDKLLQDAQMLDAKITFGVIIRDKPDSVRDLQRYLHNKDVNVVFKKFSLDNLFIVYPAEFEKLQQLKNQE
jgi:hypothetical protein